MNLTKKFLRVIAFVLFAVIALQLPVVALARESQPGITDNAISTTLSGDDAHILSEDATLRDEYTKHFVLSDGSMLAASYSVPVHYYKNDEWKDIDNTLVSECKNGFGYPRLCQHRVGCEIQVCAVLCGSGAS